MQRHVRGFDRMLTVEEAAAELTDALGAPVRAENIRGGYYWAGDVHALLERVLPHVHSTSGDAPTDAMPVIEELRAILGAK